MSNKKKKHPNRRRRKKPGKMKKNIGAQGKDGGTLTADTESYGQMMFEIKMRSMIIGKLLRQEINLIYDPPQTETIALQIRLMIESIALASLSANKTLFEQENNKFKQFWKADRIFEDIEKKNPDFYPQPIKAVPSNPPGNYTSFDDIKFGFMTRDKIVKVHKECCDFLHAKNPYAPKRDYRGFVEKVPNWMDEITTLLLDHRITLLNDDFSYTVHMHHKKDGKDVVAMFQWGKVPDHIHEKMLAAKQDPNTDYLDLTQFK